MHPPNTPQPAFQLDLNPDRRREFLKELNVQLTAARKKLVAGCFDRGGTASCATYTTDMDCILQSIYAWLAEEAGLTPDAYGRIAIIAQGGYGRMELNLHSDIDLLFLMPDSATPVEQAFVKSFLHALWDLSKLDVGYATKRLAEALLAVGTDLDSTTALIEVRLVAGNAQAFETLTTKLFHILHGNNQKWFITSKLAEWKNRREKYGSSVYLLEPNVKDGEGGLRDVHSMEWLSYVVLGSSDLHTLVKRDILRDEELDSITRAMDFLLRVRTLLHATEGRKVDVLTFDKQPGVARELGYKSDTKFLAEERMMRDYYQHARMIDRYSQKATRVLTARARSIVGGVFETIRRRSVNSYYHMKDGVLYLKMPTAEFFRRDVDRVMECFWLAASLGATIGEELKDVLMEAHIVLDAEKLQHSRKTRESFMGILGQKQQVAATLHAMHETEILGDYIPEFMKLFCVARIDHYHKYTVDEHLVKTLEISEALINGSTEEQPSLVRVAREIERWDLLNLSLLLHDIGKGEGHGHVLRGGILSQKITQRMGLPPEDQEIVRQLILQHLKMVHISQRRDLDDPAVIREMAESIGSVEMLRMLYVLTYCDTRAVGPNAWTDWKASLLQNLYEKTRLYLEGENPMAELDDSAQQQIAGEIAMLLGDEANEEEIRSFLTNASQKYLALVPPARMAHHIRMIRKLSPDTNRIMWEVNDPAPSYTELTAVSYDVPGFMSHVCGALSSKNINILGVQVFSSKDGYAIDIFQVTDLRGNKLPHGFRLDRLRNDLNSVLLGEADPRDKFPIRPRARFVSEDLVAMRPPEVIITNDLSHEFTVLEIKAFDRAGLLYDITSVCASQSYYIHLAMITTTAYRVVDVFYITDLEFNKLEPQQMKKLKAALEEVIR